MTQPKKQLHELLGSVAKDTPSLEQSELRALLSGKTSTTSVGTHLQASVIKENRMRGSTIKGLLIMTTIGLFLTAMLFLFSSHESNKITNKNSGISSTTLSTVQNTNSVISNPGPENKTLRPASHAKDTAFHILKFDPINLSSLRPIIVGANQLGKIGLLKDDQGEVIMYHGDTKVTFPAYEAASSGIHEKDERAKAFTNIAIHPFYATDSKGNLLMIYKYVKDSNSTMMSLNLLDNEERIKQALSSNYYRLNQALSQQGGDLDSSTTPWLVKNVKYQFTVGIMSFDTIMTDIYHEQNPIVAPIMDRLAAKDSLYKMQFGGEAGLKERFQFPIENSKFSSAEKKIADSLGMIENTIENRKQMLQKQMLYIGSLIKSNYPDTLKLKLEQLSHKIGYEAYILEHQEEAKKLESIGSLVPILVRNNTGMKKDPKFDNGLIFWYEPSEELFNAIPQARERAAVDNAVFHTSDEVKNVVLYPNPASLYLFVRYTVSEPSTVNISILDLLGRTIAENISSHTVSSGEQKESISLGNIPPGIYLVLIQTDKGKESMQRLIIEK